MIAPHLYRSLDKLNERLNISDFVPGASVQLNNRVYPTAQTDILGMVFGPTTLTSYHSVLKTDILDSGDIYLIRKNTNYDVNGISLELYLDGIVSKTEGSILKEKIESQEGYAGGTIKMLKNDEGKGNVHLIWVDNEDNIKKPHYHNKLTEIYFVLKGKGKMQLQNLVSYKQHQKLDFEEFSLKPGDFFLVPKEVIHNSVADKGNDMLIQVIGLPHFYTDDMNWVE